MFRTLANRPRFAAFLATLMLAAVAACTTPVASQKSSATDWQSWPGSRTGGAGPSGSYD